MSVSSPTAQCAFYGRIARNDTADAIAARQWQEGRCRAAAAARGAQITAWFFDTACRADQPLASRPAGIALLARIADPDRRADAVITQNADRVLPRRNIGAAYAVCSLLAARHAPLLLADTGIVICSAEDFDLIAGVLLGTSRHAVRPRPGNGQVTGRVRGPRR